MQKIQQLVTIIIIIILLGTGAELFLIGHYEDNKQLIPIVFIISSIGGFLLIYFNYNHFLIILFRSILVLCSVSGLLGIWFHLQANLEFESEMYPSRNGWELFRESLSGALPILAPGSMVVIGMIGYLYTLLKSFKK